MIFLYSTSLALNFKVIDIIKIGHGAGGIAWSPDGKWLAYFKDKQLMLADSLGKSHSAAKISSRISRFCWVSNEEVAITLTKRISRWSSDYKLILVNIKTGSTTNLDKYLSDRKKYRFNRLIPRQINGPYLTVEGNAYYILKNMVRIR